MLRRRRSEYDQYLIKRLIDLCPASDLCRDGFGTTHAVLWQLCHVDDVNDLVYELFLGHRCMFRKDLRIPQFLNATNQKRRRERPPTYRPKD